MQRASSPGPFLVLRGHSDVVNAVCFAPRKNLLVSGSADGELRVWNVETARCSTLASAHTTSVLSVAALPAHDAIVSSSRDGHVKLWKLEHVLTAESSIATMQTHAHHFCNAAVDGTMANPDLVWTPSVDPSKLLCWDVRTPASPVAVFAPREDFDNQGLSMHMKMHSESSQLLVGYESGCIVGFDLRTHEAISKRQLFSDPVSAFDVGRSGRMVAGSTGSQFCFLSSTAGDAEPNFVDLPKPGVGSVSIRPDEKIVAIGGWDSRVRVYDLKRQRALALLRFHELGVYSVAFNEDNQTLATASKDHRIGLFTLFPPKPS